MRRCEVLTMRPRHDPAVTPRSRGADDRAETTTRPTPPRRGGRGRRRGQGSGGTERRALDEVRAVAESQVIRQPNEGRSTCRERKRN